MWWYAQTDDDATKVQIKATNVRDETDKMAENSRKKFCFDLFKKLTHSPANEDGLSVITRPIKETQNQNKNPKGLEENQIFIFI